MAVNAVLYWKSSIHWRITSEVLDEVHPYAEGSGIGIPDELDNLLEAADILAASARMLHKEYEGPVWTTSNSDGRPRVD
jgi:hypothetical protein